MIDVGRRARAAVCLGAVIGVAACSDSGVSRPIGPSAVTAATAIDLAFCVSENNRYRAQHGRPALLQSAYLESFARAAAESDQRTGTPHGYFSVNATGNRAENEALRWVRSSSVQSLMALAISRMYAEGPGGGHYENIVGPYAELGCGVAIDGQQITIAMDFRQ